MKALPVIALALLLLSGCGDNRVEKQREAMEREIARQVELRSDKHAERKLASTRMIILGSIAVICVVVLCSLSADPPEDRERFLPSATPQSRPPRVPTRRRERRIIDLGP